MKPRVTVIGEFQRGKSTLINCLLNGEVAATGNGLPTTHIPVYYQFGGASTVQGRDESGEWFESSPEEFLSISSNGRWSKSTFAIVSLHNPLLLYMDIVDTPGFDADDQDTEAAVMTAQTADLLILLMTKDFPAYNKQFVDFIRKTIGKRPYGLIVNCGLENSTKYPRVQASQDLESSICAKLAQEGLSKPIFRHRVNLLWIYDDFVRETGEIRKLKGWTEREFFSQSGFEGLQEKLLAAVQTLKLRAGTPQNEGANLPKRDPYAVRPYKPANKDIFDPFK